MGGILNVIFECVSKGIGAVAYLRTVGPESAVAFSAGTAEGSILFTRCR